MVYRVIEDVEDRVGDRVIRRKIIRTDDVQYPSGYRYALHYGYTDGRGTGTTTKIKRSDDTKATRQTALKRSSSRG